jgi:hypothetical protein
MKNFLLSVSLALLAAGAMCAADTTPYWVEPCANPKTNCVAADVDLARWALAAWETTSAGRLRFVETKNRGEALLRVRWVDPTLGLYGETVPIEVNGRRGSELFISIMEASGNDKLLRDTIVYLTCLHESSHALGLRHTREFADIMYSFQYGGDIPEYFGRYRRKLATREDIRKNSGISPADRAHLLESVTEAVAR